MWWWYCWYCCRSFKKLANRNALLFCQLKLLLEQTTRRAAQNANQTNRQSGRLADRLQYHGKPSRLLLVVVVLLLMCETQLRVGCPTTPVRPSLRARASPDAHKTTNHDNCDCHHAETVSKSPPLQQYKASTARYRVHTRKNRKLAQAGFLVHDRARSAPTSVNTKARDLLIFPVHLTPTFTVPVLLLFTLRTDDDLLLLLLLL